MANRLQKTLDVKPSVASVGGPQAADTSLARTISGVTAIASDAILEQKKVNLDEELQELGQEVFAVTEGRDLEDASKRFQKLKKAKEQGILTDSMVNIQAEKILKQKIGSNAVFAPELRQAAARILGFDPTGSEVQALFGKGGRTSPRRPLTQQEKRRQQAEGISNVTGTNADDLERMIAKGEESKIRLGSATTAAGLGQIGSNQLLSATLEGTDSFVSDAMGDILTQIQEGGVVSPELTVARFQQAKEVAWNQHRAAQQQAGINPSAQDLTAQRKTLDDHFAPIIDLAGDKGTMDVILNRQRSSTVAAASIIGFQMFPALGAIGASPLGQAGVQEYLKLSTRMQDPRQMELLQRQNPSLAAIAGNMAEASKAMTASYNRILGLPTTVAAQVDPVLDQQVTRDLIKNVDEVEVRQRVLESVRARGQSFKSIGDYGQPGVRARVTPDEVTYIQERFGVEMEPLIARVAASTKDTPIRLTVLDGKLKASISIAETRQVGQFGFSTSVPSAIQADIQRLNGMNRLVQNGWSGDVNENAFGFLERTVNKIETLKADTVSGTEVDEVGEAISVFTKVPSPENFEAIRKLDPDLAASVESELARRKGGSTDGE